MTWIIPIWIGIFFNLFITILMMLVPPRLTYRSRVLYWFFDEEKNFWIVMIGVWSILIGWALMIGVKQ